MNEIPSRRFCLRILVFLILAFSLTPFWSYLQLHNLVFRRWLPPDKMGYSLAKSNCLGVASSMSILSLPARVDRRRDMDTLRHLLGIPESEWEYTDAVASTDKRVLSVLDWIQYLRSTFVNLEPSHAPKYQFSWPNEKDINRLVKSDTALELWDTSPWISPFRKDPGPNSFSGSNSKANYPVVPCMIKDFSFPFSARNTTIPPHKILTPARIACWYSHLEAIQRIANSPVQHAEDTTIILEDDVDMESDIKEQLGMLWKNLPRHWDIVFLGHCWSNESFHPSLSLNYPHSLHNLHPSHHPQCTHAYVLSRTGARRILLHLRYPPFAFSRAIDQALAWLVESGRIKAFSVVPSLVVQRKVRGSDISGGKGGHWKEKLRKGILDSVPEKH